MSLLFIMNGADGDACDAGVIGDAGPAYCICRLSVVACSVERRGSSSGSVMTATALVSMLLFLYFMRGRV
jgi:hypothetical protein